MTNHETRALRAVLTVTVETRPDGGHYFDQADFTAHAVQWVKSTLRGQHAVDQVTVVDQAAELARAQAEAHQYRTALEGVARKAAVSVPPPAPRADAEAVARVRALHVPDDNGECQHCRASYDPCPTIRALDGEQPAVGPCVAGEQQNETPEATPEFVGTQPCGHDDYHDGHPWHDRPGVWCPGIGYDEPAAGVRQNGAQPCAECSHPKDAHREGDDPVTPGICGVCDAVDPDEAHHDFAQATP